MDRTLKDHAASPPAARHAADARVRALRGEQSPFSAGALSNETIESDLLTGERATLHERYFGAAQYNELRRLARESASALSAESPLILILPGIMGSKLGRKGTEPFEDVIWLEMQQIAQGRLTELDMSRGTNELAPLGAVPASYLALKLRLRARGFEAQLLAYDWRQSIIASGANLADELIRHSHRRVHLVAHSMGGLVARACLAHNPKNLGRVVMIGTPNRGSFSPLQTIRGDHTVIRTLAHVDRHHTREDIARLFAGFPGLYEIIASTAEGDMDLFDIGSWPQEGLLPSQAHLNAARVVLRALPAYYDDLFLIAGVNQKTVVGASVSSGEFQYQRSGDGDGSVPVNLALIDCRKAYFVQEEHGRLPNNAAVAGAIADILTAGATSLLPELWEACGSELPLESTQRRRAAQPAPANGETATSKPRTTPHIAA